MPEQLHLYIGDLYMKQTVEAGILNDMKNFIKSLSSILLKGFDKLIDIGLSVDDVKKTKEGGFRFLVTTGGGRKIEVTCNPVKGMSDVFDMLFKSQTGESKEYKNVKDTDFTKKITEAIDDMFEEGVEKVIDERDGSDVMNSRKLNITLKRVCGSSEDSIQLTAISANYDVNEALANLKDLIADDSFIENVEESPKSFEVVDDGSNLLVSETDPLDCSDCCCDGLEKILRRAYITYFNAQCIHWNAKGEDFFELHEYSDSIIYSLKRHIDTIAELCVECNNVVQHPLKLLAGCNDYLDSYAGFTRDTGYSILVRDLKQFIDVMEFYLCNFSSDIQSTFNEIIREFKAEVNYKLRRQEM